MPNVQAILDVPSEAWNAMSAAMGALSAIVIERLRANRKLDERAEEILDTLGDLSQQVASMDTRVTRLDGHLWAHVEQHNRGRSR